MEHEKAHLPKAYDLQAHMERKRVIEQWKARLDSMRLMTSTYGLRPKSLHEQNVDEYVSGIIDHDEYERREESRLSSEAAALKDTP